MKCNLELIAVQKIEIFFSFCRFRCVDFIFGGLFYKIKSFLICFEILMALISLLLIKTIIKYISYVFFLCLSLTRPRFISFGLKWFNTL